MKRKTESEKTDKVFVIVARRCTAFRQKPRALFRAIRNGPAAKGAREQALKQKQKRKVDAKAETEAKAESKKSRASSEQVTKAVTARGIHLFPFRTEKLNPATPMVLRKWESR